MLPGDVMSYVSILHAPEDVAFAERIAAGLARRGCEACPVSGDALEGDLAVEDAPAVVLWTPRSVSLPSVMRHARAALERGALVPIKTLGVALGDEFAALAPADLTGWMGDDGDPRWRFVAEEVALITARTRLQDGEVWASAETSELTQKPATEGTSPEVAAADSLKDEGLETRYVGASSSVSENGASLSPTTAVVRKGGFRPRHVLYAASAALMGFTILAALAAPIFFTRSNNEQQLAAPTEPQPGPASLSALTVETLPLEANSENSSPAASIDDALAEPEFKSPPPLRDVEPIAVAAAIPPELSGTASSDEELLPVSAPRVKPSTERIVSAAALDAEETSVETVAVPMDSQTGNELVGNYLRDCFACPDLAIVPAGRFVMGSPSTERARHDAEGPVSLVDIVSGFAMAAREVTMEQWDACVAGGGCRAYSPPAHGWGRGKQPVVSVSYEDAQSYAVWLSQETGRAYRLPSEAEWEYAARAGTVGAFSFGGRITSEDANYNTAYTYGGPVAESAGRTLETATFPPNAFGLYDMHGNVWEWTADCWFDSHQDTDVNGAPRGAENGGDCTRRVLKGGAWNTGGWRLRSAHRIGKQATVREYDNGFRVVRALD